MQEPASDDANNSGDLPSPASDNANTPVDLPEPTGETVDGTCCFWSKSGDACDCASEAPAENWCAQGQDNCAACGAVGWCTPEVAAGDDKDSGDTPGDTNAGTCCFWSKSGGACDCASEAPAENWCAESEGNCGACGAVGWCAQETGSGMGNSESGSRMESSESGSRKGSSGKSKGHPRG